MRFSLARERKTKAKKPAQQSTINNNNEKATQTQTTKK
jgi:hypothetical protein